MDPVTSGPLNCFVLLLPRLAGLKFGYLAARLLEAWDAVQRANPGMVHITPEGEPSTGNANETLIPDDPEERKTYAMRIIASGASLAWTLIRWR